MKVAGTIQDSIVDGPSLRYVVFAQGCPHCCEGCHNPESHDLAGGQERSVEELISEMLGNPLTDGLTLSGGEPFTQASDCARLAKAAREKGLNVWTYSGWTYDELLELSEYDEGTAELLEHTDVLVDGRFELAGRSLELRFRGSANQRIIDMNESRRRGEPVLLNLQS